jgi:hypothetical protein
VRPHLGVCCCPTAAVSQIPPKHAEPEASRAALGQPPTPAPTTAAATSCTRAAPRSTAPCQVVVVGGRGGGRGAAGQQGGYVLGVLVELWGQQRPALLRGW